MTSHVSILGAAIRSRPVWTELAASPELAEFPEDLADIIASIRAYYDTDEHAQSVDTSLLRSTLEVAVRDPKRRALLLEVLAQLEASDPSIPNARRAVRLLGQRRVAEKLATQLLLPSKDGVPVPDLIDEYTRLSTEDEADDAPQWTSEVIAPAVSSPRVPIYPRAVGERLRGGLWPGHHMTVFARPEMGKSAFAINVAVMAASRGKAKVLYLSNEDSTRDLMLRALVRFNNQSPDEVLKDLDTAIDKARAYGADRLLFRDMAPGSLAEIDRLARKYKPDLLIVDQMRNIGAGGKGENMTQRLDAIAQGLRNIGKRHAAAVLSITQAGDSARDKAILDDGDVDNSNTGVSAGCDVLLGIGATAIMREAGERRVSIIKNKLGGTHGYADVRFDPITLAFRDPQ